MKNVSSLKYNNTNTPKTPGGISKSLLTPCRRVGLSRNWRKSGPSPFISPLSSNSAEEIKVEQKETRKRKEHTQCENEEDVSDYVENVVTSTGNLDKTPRKVEVPHRKKSKTLLSTIGKSQEDTVSHSEGSAENSTQEVTVVESENMNIPNVEDIDLVTTPVRTKSKNIKINTSDMIDVLDEVKIDPTPKYDKGKEISPVEQTKNADALYSIKEKSLNDLSKECILVIQRKIFKGINKSNGDKDINIKANEANLDSDEAPLINIQRQNSIKTIAILDDDDDFINSKTVIPKPTKLKDTKSSKIKHPIKPTKANLEKVKQKSTDTCFDDDDDDDFESKKTILIRKTYDKVNKPVKAKSTGSITQKDIDNLRSRIEAKKKLLLAQSLTPDTEELRTLIKKWQKGCQDALMELLDLMRSKFPDKERMNYSEMLNNLKIPPSLVGYDSENDCFKSPDDASIVLGQFKDI